MRIIIAPDSFKGSMSSAHITDIVETVAMDEFKNCEVEKIPIADGGEGTLDAILATIDGRKETITVKSPVYTDIDAEIAFIDDKNRAIIEMAQASGLPLLKPEQRDPRYTTTYGTGQLIAYALDKGFKDIYIAIGGSATNDGGIGAMQALGAKFLDKNGNEVKGVGDSLSKIESIDCTGMNENIKSANFTVMCDVTNPLTGKDGATYVYSRQKGATDETIDILEEGMLHYEKKLIEYMNISTCNIPGAGAAGGIGMALTAFLNAKLKSGIDTILEIIDFETKLKGTDLVITGEGMMDSQSVFGKVAAGIGNACKKKNIPVLAIVGSMGSGAEDIYSCGVSTIIPTVNGVMSLDKAIDNCDSLLQSAARRAFKAIKIGMSFNCN